MHTELRVRSFDRPVLTMKIGNESDLNITPPELNDESAVRLLDSAIVEKEEKKIEECMAYLLMFPEEMHEAFNHFFKFYSSLASASTRSYLSIFFNELLVRLKKCLDPKESLNAYFQPLTDSSKYYCPNFLELLLNHEERPLAILMIELLIEWKIPCTKDSKTLIVKIVEDLLVEENIPPLLTCLEILKRSDIQLNEFTPINEDDPRLIAGLLTLAFKNHSEPLLQASLDIMIILDSKQGVRAELYSRIYHLYPEEKLRDWVLESHKNEDVFAFLDVGLKYLHDPSFLQICLNYIENHQIHRLMPRSLDCTSLLNFNNKENEHVFIFKNDEHYKLYPFPEMVLEARAAEVRAPNTIISPFYGFDVVEFMMGFIMHPKKRGFLSR